MWLVDWPLWLGWQVVPGIAWHGAELGTGKGESAGARIADIEKFMKANFADVVTKCHIDVTFSTIFFLFA